MVKLAAKASTPDEEDYGSLWKVTELSQMIYKSVCKSESHPPPIITSPSWGFLIWLDSSRDESGHHATI